MTAETMPNPFDPEQYRLPQGVLDGFEVDTILTTVDVRKPQKQEFFRVHPDAAYSMAVSIIEVKADRKIYIVNGAVAAAFPNDCTPAKLVLAVNLEGTPFIWCLKQAKDGQAGNAWYDSANSASEHAKQRWLRVDAQISKGRYEVQAAKGAIKEPQFPLESFNELLVLAFGSMRIDSPDHEVIKRLQGEM